MGPCRAYQHILTWRGTDFQLDPAAGKNMDFFNTGELYDDFPVDPEKHFRVQQLLQVFKREIERVMMVVTGA
jgi:hypothetical protein